MKTKLNKIIVVTMLVIMLLPMQLIQVFATDIGDSPYLQRGKLGDYIVQYYNGSYWTYISYNIVTYDDGTESRKIAYCVTPNTPGIEWTSESVDGYNVNITELLSDPVLWRVLRHGYPYATPEQLGVEGEEDAYLATKIAIQCILLNRSTDSIKTFYRGGRDAVAGLKLADITRRGDKVVNAIYNLVNNARNSNETPANNTIVNATKVGDLKAEGNYYSQEYSVSSSTQMSYYTINKIVGFTSGSFASDVNGNAKTQFNNGENFKIMIPKSSARGNISGEITIDAHCETYSIFYGESTKAGYQNYALYTDPYRDLRKTVLTNVDLPKGEIKIIKTDKDTGKTIAGVTFNAKYSDGTNIGDFTTDANGVIEIKDLNEGTVILTETKTQNSYVLNTNKTNVDIGFDETKTVTITNEKKKGQIKVVKIDQDNKEVKLEGVTFEVLDSKGSVVQEITTDKNGEATTKKLPIDEEYTIKEKSTKQEYVLSDKVEKVTLKQDQITSITFENEKKKGQIKVVKIDQDNKEVKLEGVTFEVLDSKGSVVQEITTDKNGEATTKRLPIDQEYQVREKSTQKTYILSNKVEKVTLKQDEIKTITFENEKKKGSLKIFKVDKDNNKIAIGNVEFDLYSNEFKKVIGTYKTDVNGEIKIDDLRVGSYKLIEKITNKWYNLADDKTTEVEWNKTTETTVENELKKGQIKVIKIDKDNNEVKLEGVKFNVLDSNGNVLETIETDSNGEALTSKYAVRDFETLTLQETETKENYKLNDEKQTITLEENQITTIKFENEKKKGQIKVVKIDQDNKEVKLEGVTFEVLDSKGSVVQKITTDKNGEATTKRLPIDEEYRVRETITKEEYVLSDKVEKVTLKEDQITNITFENERKKGQIEVFKIDSEDKEYKLEGVEFEVINSDNEVVEKITTDENGEATTSRLPIGEYKIKEVKTDEMHILNDEVIKVDVTQDIISKLEITNDRKKGQIKVVKTSKDENIINGLPAGTPLENVKFEVYDSNKKLVDTITTDEDGIAITKKLDKGTYTLKEVETAEWYLLNKDEFETEIKENDEIVEVDVTNESETPEVDIEKTGVDRAMANEEIRYDFKIKNTGNVALDNFTWTDYLPSDYVRITKLATGTYNQELKYAVYYKTNKNDYKLLKDDLNTKENNYIDFTELELDEDEYVTEFKAEFGTVDVGFESVENPYIFTTVNSTVKDGDIFINKTKIKADNKGVIVWDEDEHPTVVYEKKEETKKLPRTGF